MAQEITAFFRFDDRAEEAMSFYVSIFKNSEVGDLSRFGEAGSGQEGSVLTASFRLNGQ